MDDATSGICAAIPVEEEGTRSTFPSPPEVFGRHGLPLSPYTDRGSHYFHTPEAGGRADRSNPTRAGRAPARLGVEHIAACPPEARGRSGRTFGTLRDRLPREPALAGIDGVDAANAWLRDTHIPMHNARFAVKAEQEGSAFVAANGIDPAEALCVEEERIVGNDNCVSFGNRRLRIPESPLRPHFVRATVKVRRYPHGGLAVFHGPRCLGRCDAAGAPIGGGPDEKPAENDVDPSRRPAWRRARARQGRFAPRCGGLAGGEAVLDGPCARLPRHGQVGSGKWSRQSHREMPVGDTAPPPDETRTSGHMMCYQNRTR